MIFSVAVAAGSDFHLSKSDLGEHFGPRPSQHWFVEPDKQKVFHCLEEIGSHIFQPISFAGVLTSWLPALANGQTPPGRVVIHISPLWAIAASLKCPPSTSNAGQKRHHRKIVGPHPAAMLGNTSQKIHYQNRSPTLSSSSKYLSQFQSAGWW